MKVVVVLLIPEISTEEIQMVGLSNVEKVTDQSEIEEIIELIPKEEKTLNLMESKINIKIENIPGLNIMNVLKIINQLNQ